MRRLQYDAPSQAVRNLITNPELVADVSDKLLFKNVIANPSFEAATGTSTVHTNHVTNPGFETGSSTVNVWTNLVTNPSFEGSDGNINLWKNLATNSTFETVLASSIVQRTNLSTNPSFEVNTTGWTATGLNAGHGRVTTRGYSGTSSVWGVATDNLGDSMYTNTVPYTVVPGATYTVSAYAWVPSGGVVASDFRDSNRNLWAVASSTIPTLVRTGNLDFTKLDQWQRVSTTIVIPAGSTFLNVRLYFPARTAGIFWDAVLVEQTDQLRPYFDGLAADARGWDYSWSGTANASTSTAAAATVELARNLAPNPRMVTSDGTFVYRRNLVSDPRAVWVYPTYSAGTITATTISGHPLGITTANRVVGTGGSNLGIAFYTAVQPNTTYTMSAWVYHESIDPGFTQQAFAQAGVISGTQTTAVVGQWTRQSWTYTTNANATQSHFGFRIAGTPSSAASFLITGILLEASPVLEEYFDGTAPVATRTNLVTNPAVSANTTGWSTYGGSGTHPSLVTSRSAASWSTSGWAFKVQGTASSIPNMAEIGVGDYYAPPGTVITGSISVLASGSRKARLRLRGLGGGGDLTSSDFTLNASTPTRISFTGTVPAGASGFSVSVKEATVSPDPFLENDWIAGSMALVERSATLGTYFDGSSSVSGDTAYGWRGAANASVSYAYSIDHSYAWIGTANASESVMRGNSATDYYRSGSDTGTPQIITDGASKILRYVYKSEINAIAVNSTALSNQAPMMEKMYTVSARVRSSINLNAVRLRLNGNNGPSVNLIAGQWQTLTYTGLYTGAGGYTGVWSPAIGTGNYGQYIDMADFMVVEGTHKSGYFDGATPWAGDYSYAWTGTPDNSASIRRATRALNVSANRNSATIDTQFHAYSAIETDERFVRYLTPAGSASSSWRVGTSLGVDYASLIAGNTYTLTVKMRASGWTTPPNVYIGLKDATGSNPVTTDTTVNAVGSTWQTFTKTFVASINGLSTTLLYISLPTDAPASTDGLFDVAEWSLVEGTYAGPAFDGSTPASTDFTYSWAGAPDASSSYTVGQSASGISNGNVKSHLSNVWARKGKSIKITPLDVSGSNATSVMVPVSLTPGKTYTVLGTRYIDKPLTGTLNSSYAGRIALVQPGLSTLASTALPNTAGEGTIRWTFTVDAAATGHTLRIGHGGAVNSGDVWWDDILVVEGTYLGPYFDGSRPAYENLAVSTPMALSNTTHTSVTYAGSTWTRSSVTQGGISLTRQSVDQSKLIKGETYTTAVTLANDQAFAQNVSFDWCDVGSVNHTLQPGEIKRIVTTGSRPLTGLTYGDVYRFSDIHVTASSTEARSILFKDWVIEKGTTSGAYYTGTGDYTYWWTGAANASTTTQGATGLSNWALCSNAQVFQSSLAGSKYGSKYGVVVTKGYNGDGAYFNDVNVTAGTTYRWSIWVKTTSAHRLDGVLRWKDNASATLSDYAAEVTSSTVVGQWSRVSISATAPANAVKVQPMWRIYATHTPTTFYLDGAILTDSPVDVQFFDGDNPDKKNLADNPSLTVNADGWSSNDATLFPAVRSTVSPIRGTASYLSTRSSATPSGTVASIYANGKTPFTLTALKVTPGDVLSFSMDIKVSQPNRRVNTYFAFRTASSVSLGISGSVFTNLTSGVVTRVGSANMTVPATADSVIVVATVTTTDGSNALTDEQVWFDGLLIEKSATMNDFYEGTGDFTYAWTGAANASTTTVTAPKASGLSTNPGGRISWQSTTGPVEGKKSVAVLAGVPNVDTFAELASLPFGNEVLGGRTFTIIATRKSTSPLPGSGNDSRAWRPLWQAQKSGGGYAVIQPPVGPTTAGTHTFKYTFTFDADVTTGYFFRLYNGSATSGSVVWWDDLAVIEGAYPGEYFDGDTVDTADNTYLWDGTVNASSSSMRAYNVKGTWFEQRAKISSSADKPFSGSHKVKATVSQIGYFPRLVTNTFVAVPGRRYSAFAKMKCSTQPVQLGIKWIAVPDIYPAVVSQSASNGNWTKVSASEICPPGATHLQLFIGVPDSSPLNTEFEIDNILLTDRLYDGPFGSGSSYGWTWEGTPHASASKGYPVGLTQLAGKPLFVGTIAGDYVLTDINPANNPVIEASAPRTIYTIVDNTLDVGPSTDVVFTYGVDDLDDTVHPNQTIMMREQQGAGDTNNVIARRTGGGGPVQTGVPSIGKQILINGLDERQFLFSGYNKSALAYDSMTLSVPHERIRIAADTIYHKHIATYIYPGVHSSALRAEMVRLLADAYNIPGLG